MRIFKMSVVVIVLVVFIAVKPSTPVMLQQRSTVQNRDVVMMWPLNQQYKVSGLIECSSRCVAAKCSCSSYIFDSATKLCSLGSILLPVQPSGNSTKGKLFSSGIFCNVSTALLQKNNGSLTPVDQLQCSSSISTVPSKTDSTSCRRVGNDYARKVVTLPAGIDVMCDTLTECGGWIIFQRRASGLVEFYLDWIDYKNGFGDFSIGEYYLGNERLHQLTTAMNYELRIDFVYNQEHYYAKYSTFRVGNESDGYRLRIWGYSGTAGDAMAYHNGSRFTTRDRDNDLRGGVNCAVQFYGGWWYNNCYLVNLNGMWSTPADWMMAINWQPALGSSAFYTNMKFCEMRMRPT